MTEAVFNFTTWNTSSMFIQMTHSDISSSEYSSNAPFHNVTILLPIVISVLVLIAVLTTLFAFMRKQDVLHEQRDCISNSAQNLHLRSSSVRSKDDMSEMMSFPMTDYHTLCQNTNSKSKLCEGNHVSTGQLRNPSEGIYSKSMISTSAILYSSPKRTVVCNADGEVQQQIIRPGRINSHHIYAEPNASLQPYTQSRCMVTNIPAPENDSLVDITNNNTMPPSNETFCALLNSNTHL